MFRNTNYLKVGLTCVLGMGLASCGQEAETKNSSLSIIDGTVPSDGGLIERSTVALVSPSGQIFCSGTLIKRSEGDTDRRSVVSAAHCVEDYSGTLYIGFGRNSSEMSFVAAANYTAHHNYTGSFGQAVPSDISSITLSKDAPRNYDPVLIASTPSTGSTIYLAGYGQTETGGSGQLFYKGVTVQGNSGDEFSVSNGACYGDSGGPAYVYDGESLSVAGATSRGSTGCVGSAIYTSVNYFSSWLF